MFLRRRAGRPRGGGGKPGSPVPATPWSSTSSTSGPRRPVALATLALGERVHHLLIWSGSVVASRWPCRVAGALPPGWQGKTGHLRRAYSSAAASRASDSGVTTIPPFFV
jgi:hypothetical protein